MDHAGRPAGMRKPNATSKSTEEHGWKTCLRVYPIGCFERFSKSENDIYDLDIGFGTF